MPMVFFAFLAVPVVEVALFIGVGAAIGLWLTVGLVVLTTFVGFGVLRAWSHGAVLHVRNGSESARGALPDGVDSATLLAGLLLLIPGFLSDVLGLALLLPPVRAALRLRGRFAAGHLYFTVMGLGDRFGGRVPDGDDYFCSVDDRRYRDVTPRDEMRE